MKISPVRYLLRNIITAGSMVLLAAALFTFSACTTTAPPPPPATGTSTAVIKEGVPGGSFVNTMEVSARVIAVDTARRKLTLKGQDGEEFTVKVGPAAVNFDQIQAGDLVNVKVTEELVVYLNEEGAAAPDGDAMKALGYMETDEGETTPDGAVGVVALAPKGAQPGGLIAGAMQVTATVTAIDPAKRTATLRFEDGSTKTFPVRDDIDLSKRQLGEKVVFHVTEMIAISVERQ